MLFGFANPSFSFQINRFALLQEFLQKRIDFT
jgi:hypothetical protein